MIVERDIVTSTVFRCLFCYMPPVYAVVNDHVTVTNIQSF